MFDNPITVHVLLMVEHSSIKSVVNCSCSADLFVFIFSSLVKTTQHAMTTVSDQR